MMYCSDKDRARMAVENETRIVGVINALLIFVIGYAFFLQIGGYIVASWIVPLSLACIGACLLQLAALGEGRLRLIRSKP